MISCSCLATAPLQFNAEAITLAGELMDQLDPGNCLQGDLYTIAYAAGVAIMAKLAVEGHLTTEADLALVLEVMRAAVADGTAQWNATHTEPLRATS